MGALSCVGASPKLCCSQTLGLCQGLYFSAGATFNPAIG